MAHFDLNLIRTLVKLYETRSVTLTAEQLYVTQPSVSYSLSRLRELCADRLFVRTRDGMEPTVIAEQLYVTFQQSLIQIDGAISRRRHFDPALSEQRFRLAMTDLGEMALLPVILRHLYAQAPGVELEVVPLEIDKVDEWLITGKVSAAICSRQISTPGIERQVIVSERYVCVINERYAPSSDNLTLEQFIHQRHAVIPRSSGHGMAEDVLNSLGIRRKISLVVPHFSILPAVLQDSDLMVVLPYQIACTFAAHAPLRVYELPFKVAPFDVAIHWQSRSAASPAECWLRTAIIEAVGAGGDDDPARTMLSAGTTE